ncbi:hypothetical protein [Planctobacterium marinum]|uniref:hypothetical protein n=1 Tax=Planctobacterium marinum TaxID=1631968 RepID=UPI001E64D0F6|nr:hypothetical protein [Planctobacterium marinum]MCC2605622.1 hypothetical protein [Planctobacterium marinum]
MRDLSSYISEYKDISLIDTERYIIKDVAIVELCLYFLSEYCPDENVSIIPGLMQGHLTSKQSDEFQKAAFTLRQYAGNLSSQLAWRKAQANHSLMSNATAFSINDGKVARNRIKNDSLNIFLAETLKNSASYLNRKVEYPKYGTGYVKAGFKKSIVDISIPDIEPKRFERVQLTKRSINPPIFISWSYLYQVARDVDARESSSSFPKWLDPLNLEGRLKRVKIKNFNSDFCQSDGIRLDQSMHLVGMLSSGKSTLLQALLFALVGTEYKKRVLFLVPDTATATKVVARLKAHGISDSTVLSSLFNRDEHLGMIHWNAQGFPSDESLNAISALTENFETACPLMGFQKNISTLGKPSEQEASIYEKPCHQIYQSAGSSNSLTCPLIHSCPTHNQQRQLNDARVVVMTPQAFLHMTPDKSHVSESLSFPEFFQYQSDIVLVDEADHVLSTFDKECAQEVDLLSGSENAFVSSNQRALASSLTELSGSQYQALSNVRWHHELNQLQSSISATFHVLLQYGEKLKWITDGRTFTGLSILSDLSKKSSNSEESHLEMEQVSLLGSMLYSGNIKHRDGHADYDKDKLNKTYASAYSKLLNLQDDVIKSVVSEELQAVIDDLSGELNGGCLSIFSNVSVNKPTDEKKKRYKNQPPEDSDERAYAIVLSLLTNLTLSSFSYLVRNQAAVEEDFDLSKNDTFREANRIFRHFGSIIPKPLFGTVFGLTFESMSDSAKGGTLKLVNHLGVGRYLLTHLNQLLKSDGQAGPHVLLVSGTSWAGGGSEDASPIYDIQLPVKAILEQPQEELESLKYSRFELVSLKENPIRVSGLPPAERKQNLRLIANELVKSRPTGTFLREKWLTLEKYWKENGEIAKDRRRALLVTNNYEDAKCVANQLTSTAGLSHPVYCLVSDQTVRKGAQKQSDSRADEPLSPSVNIVPRSKVEEFGHTPSGSILVAPLTPISRGHNIITKDGYAAISTIFFLHRPHPRPDDYTSVIGMVNKLALNFMNGSIGPLDGDLSKLQRWYSKAAKVAVANGFDLRTSYSYMPEISRKQFSWDLMTSVWQTIGRGIRKGVPIYVGFMDSQFSPGTFSSPPKADTCSSSCLLQMKETLSESFDSKEGEIAKTLYLPLFDALESLYN